MDAILSDWPEYLSPVFIGWTSFHESIFTNQVMSLLSLVNQFKKCSESLMEMTIIMKVLQTKQ